MTQHKMQSTVLQHKKRTKINTMAQTHVPKPQQIAQLPGMKHEATGQRQWPWHPKTPTPAPMPNRLILIQKLVCCLE